MTGSDGSPIPGELLRLSFKSARGTEQAGFRPALVISGADFNAYSGRALVLPITSRIRGWRTEVLLPRTSPVVGVVLTHQAQTIDWRAREVTRLGRVDSATLELARDRLLILIERG